MTRLFVAESPAAYAQRPRLVVDASLVAAALFAEAEADVAIAWMRGRAARVVELAARYGLTACDASYLSLAEALRAPLATFDRRLGLAAQSLLGEAGS